MVTGEGEFEVFRDEVKIAWIKEKVVRADYPHYLRSFCCASMQRQNSEAVMVPEVQAGLFAQSRVVIVARR